MTCGTQTEVEFCSASDGGGAVAVHYRDKLARKLWDAALGIIKFDAPRGFHGLATASHRTGRQSLAGAKKMKDLKIMNMIKRTSSR